MTQSLALELKKHNAQYPAIEVREFKGGHDCFLILDDKPFTTSVRLSKT